MNEVLSSRVGNAPSCQISTQSGNVRLSYRCYLANLSDQFISGPKTPVVGSLRCV